MQPASQGVSYRTISISLLVIAVVFVGAFVYAYSEYSGEVSTANQLSSEKQTIQGQLAAAEANVTMLLARKANLEAEVTSLQTKTSADDAVIAKLDANVTRLSSQKASLQAQVTSLNSQVSHDTTEIDNLNSQISSDATEISQLSLYQKTFPVLQASYTCDAGMGLGVTLTNVGNQSIVVPAFGVKVIAPNGTQDLPTPGTHMSFYVFGQSQCLGTTSPGNQTAITVPAGGTRYVEVTDSSLAQIGQTGNYILTFANVTTTSNQSVTASPVWISWVEPSPAGFVLGQVSFPATGQEGYVFITNDGPNFVYVNGVSLSYGGSGCSQSVTPPKDLPQGAGLSFQWTYSNGDPCPNSPASVGEAFSGFVTLTNGHQIAFNGAFQQ